MEENKTKIKVLTGILVGLIGVAIIIAGILVGELTGNKSKKNDNQKQTSLEEQTKQPSTETEEITTKEIETKESESTTKQTTTSEDIEEISIEDEKEFTEVNERVTAKIKTNLRTAPSLQNSSVVATIVKGEEVVRTGVGIKGWSRVEYNGQELYAISSYLKGINEPDREENLQTQPTGVEVGIQFESVDERVTAKIETNLRTEPSSKREDTIVVTIKNGEWVRRIGIGSNGWSKVEYNGQILYAITSYLTTEGN